MNKEEFAKELKEILALVKLCPQNLQEKCFEVLLSYVLSAKGDRFVQLSSKGGAADMTDTNIQDIPPEIKKRIKTFAGSHQLSEAEIYKVFNIEETGNVSIEATDLKSKKYHNNSVD